MSIFHLILVSTIKDVYCLWVWWIEYRQREEEREEKLQSSHQVILNWISEEEEVIDWRRIDWVVPLERYCRYCKKGNWWSICRWLYFNVIQGNVLLLFLLESEMPNHIIPFLIWIQWINVKKKGWNGDPNGSFPIVIKLFDIMYPKFFRI